MNQGLLYSPAMPAPTSRVLIWSGSTTGVVAVDLMVYGAGLYLINGQIPLWITRDGGGADTCRACFNVTDMGTYGRILEAYASVNGSGSAAIGLQSIRTDNGDSFGHAMTKIEKIQ